MKIKKGYLVREVAGENIVVSTEKREVDFDYIIHLNDSAKLLFEALMEDDLEEKDLVNILLDNYEVEEDVATKDVSEFVEMLKLNDII
ncbi:MAG: PqqD family protein [Acholeplasmataceae bacterium]